MASRPCPNGISRPTATSTRCCCMCRTSSSTGAKSSSRPTSNSRCASSARYFSDSDKARNVDYYEPRTVRDSSLSANVQAVICAEVGHLELAHDYAFEAALIDLHDIHHNTRDGLHIASLAGAWVALVFGFGGLRIMDGALHFKPQLPAAITRLCFNVRCHGSQAEGRHRRRRSDLHAFARPATDDDESVAVVSSRRRSDHLARRRNGDAGRSFRSSRCCRDRNNPSVASRSGVRPSIDWIRRDGDQGRAERRPGRCLDRQRRIGDIRLRRRHGEHHAANAACTRSTPAGCTSSR